MGTVSNGFDPGLEHPTLPVCHVSVGGSGLGLNSKASASARTPWTFKFLGRGSLKTQYGVVRLHPSNDLGGSLRHGKRILELHHVSETFA